MTGQDTMMMASDILTTKDVEFLTTLANELKTQDTACTAKPVIYQIREAKKDVPIETDYADGVALIIGEDGESFYDDDVVGAKESLICTWEFEWDERIKLGEAKTLADIAQFCEDIGIRNHYTSYRNTETFQGFFLTKEALLRHLEANRHHYSEPVSYAQAAGWRNPELERLLTIVEKFATTSKEAPR